MNNTNTKTTAIPATAPSVAKPTTAEVIGKIPAMQVDISGDVLSIVFSDGNEIVIDASKLSADIAHHAMMHGLKQKLVDAGAIARDVDTGKSATIRDKYNAVADVASRLIGTAEEPASWNKPRAEGGGKTSNNTLLARALMQLSGKTLAVIAAFLDGKTSEQKNALKKDAKVAKIMLEMQMAKLGDSTSNVDELLSELGEAAL